MTIEEITHQADTLWDVAAVYAVAFGMFTPGALRAARQLAPVPVPPPSQNAPLTRR